MMTSAKPRCVGLLLTTVLLAACGTPSVGLGSSTAGPQAAKPDVRKEETWASYPVLAHQLRGKEAPIVRWIDTDGDGVSNYRLLCTFEEGRVQVKKAVPDASLRQRFRQAKR